MLFFSSDVLIENFCVVRNVKYILLLIIMLFVLVVSDLMIFSLLDIFDLLSIIV